LELFGEAKRIGVRLKTTFSGDFMAKAKTRKLPATKSKSAAKSVTNPEPKNVKVGPPQAPVLYGLKPRKQYLPWSHARERLERSRSYWICTARPDGRPHSIPVWGMFIDDVLYFGTSRDSRKARNLEHNAAVSIHLESGDDVVIVEGAAQQIARSDKRILSKLDGASKKKYKMPLMIVPESVFTLCVPG
jgi:Pyridoxamine 5'-phosphate oxidase